MTAKKTAAKSTAPAATSHKPKDRTAKEGAETKITKVAGKAVPGAADLRIVESFA